MNKALFLLVTSPLFPKMVIHPKTQYKYKNSRTVWTLGANVIKVPAQCTTNKYTAPQIYLLLAHHMLTSG